MIHLAKGILSNSDANLPIASASASASIGIWINQAYSTNVSLFFLIFGPAIGLFLFIRQLNVYY
jgi:hypothetical protein